MKRLAILLLLAPVALAGTVRHVVPSGGVTSGAALTEGTGWTLAWAFNTGNAAVAGDTIYLHAGTYTSATGWDLDKDGADGSPIIYRNYPGDTVIISAGDVDYTTFDVMCSYVWLWGLEFDHPTTDNYSITTISTGASTGPGFKVINCIIRNAGRVASTSYRGAKQSEYYGNIYLFSGQNFDGSKHGYAFYTQNARTDGWKYFTDNIIGWNWGLAIHGYSSNDSVENIRFRGNVIFNPGRLWRTTQYEAANYFGIENEGAAFIDSIDWAHNSIWYDNNIANGGYGLYAFYGSKINKNVKLDSNIVTGSTGVYALQFYTGTTFRSLTGNIIETSWYPTGLNSSYTNNTWNGTRRSTGDTAIVRMNAYEAKRAHLVVYNWDAGDSVSVDPTGFTSGDTLTIRNIQNLKGDTPFTKVYAGTAFNIPMAAARWSIETPQTSNDGLPSGSLAETFPDFGVFLITGVAATEEPPAYAPPKRRVPFIKR